MTRWFNQVYEDIKRTKRSSQETEHKYDNKIKEMQAFCPSKTQLTRCQGGKGSCSIAITFISIVTYIIKWIGFRIIVTHFLLVIKEPTDIRYFIWQYRHKKIVISL